MMLPSIEELVNNLSLKKHWTSDYLAEFYRSEIVLPRELIGKKFDGDRPLFNWAYYLIPGETICPFHLHLADESWQYCLGDPLELLLIHSDGKFERVLIGPDIHRNQRFIYIVPKNVWMAARVNVNIGYTLVTHLVAPAFFPQDNAKGYYHVLIDKFPEHKTIIEEFAWPDGK